MKPTTRFHNVIDTGMRPYQVYSPALGWQPFPTYITLRQRSLTYQFFPHFYPYVAANRAFVPNMQLSLMERLKEGGLAELEHSDTLYMPQPNPPSGQPVQPLNIIPGSTRAALAADATAIRPTDNATLSVSVGTPLTLPDGTIVNVPAQTVVLHADGTTSKLPADTQFPVPGQIPISVSSGIQIAGTDIIVPDF